MNIFEMPDIGIIRECANDLKSLLGSAAIVERRAFLKSFVKENIADLVITEQGLMNDGTKLMQIKFYPVDSTTFTPQ